MKRICAAGRGSWAQVRGRTPVRFPSPASAKFAEPLLQLVNELAREASFPGSGIRAGAAAEARGSEAGTHFAGISGGRAAAQSFVRGASLRARFRRAKRRWRRTSARICRACIAKSTRRKMRCCCWSAILIARAMLKSDREGIWRLDAGRSRRRKAAPAPAETYAGGGCIWCTCLARCRRRFLRGAMRSHENIRTG